MWFVGQAVLWKESKRPDRPADVELPQTDSESSVDSMRQALMAFRAKDAVMSRGVPASKLHTLAEQSLVGLPTKVRLGDRSHMALAVSGFMDTQKDRLPMTNMLEEGVTGLVLETRGQAVLVQRVISDSPASISSHPIHPGDQVPCLPRPAPYPTAPGAQRSTPLGDGGALSPWSTLPPLFL